MSPRRRAALVLATIAALLAPAAHAMGGAQDCQPEDLAPVDAWLATHPWRAGATTPDALAAFASDALDAPVRGGVTATRSLFVPEGTGLRIVLDGLVLATHDQVRADDIRTTSATIAIDAHRSGGFADLRITRTTNSTARGSVATHTQDRTTLAYDGRGYRGASSDVVHQDAPEGETAQGSARQP